MRFRTERPEIRSIDEHALAESIRAASGGDPVQPPVPGAYWQNLIIRTNRRLDHATSGKALSISWAARVAIPGVVAILSFYIGLHYYAPGLKGADTLTSVVLSLPEPAVDSLLADPSQIDASISVTDLVENLFDIPKEQMAEYFIDHGRASSLMEAMTDDQVNEVLSTLGARKDL